MKKESIFYLAIIFTIVGLFLTGLGVGKIFNKGCEGAIVGVGIGFTITALKLFNIFRRIDVYEKK
jgi:hypothetical protein